MSTPGTSTLEEESPPRPIVEWPALSEHERLLVLQQLLADFAQEQPEEVLARTMLDRILPFMGASAGSVYVLSPDGQTLVMIAAYGPSREQVQSFGRVPLQARFPCADVMRAGQSAWYESTEVLFAHYPELAVPGSVTRQSVALLPFRSSEPAVAGVLSVSLTAARAFTPLERTYLENFAHILGQGLARARLRASERRAHAELQVAELQSRTAAERLRVLAEVSRVFASAPLDPAVALDTVVREVSRHLAESAVITLLSEDGQVLVPSAAYYQSPELREAAELSLGRKPMRLGEGSSADHVVRTGKPLLVPEVDQQVLLARSPPEHREVLARFPIRGFAVVPLRVQGRIIGTLNIYRYTPGQPPLTPSDLELLEALADRAGMLLANAQLLEGARRAVQLREEFLSVASHELRTPLTSLKLQHQLLSRSLAEPAKAPRRLEAAERQVQRMAALVENLLDVSRIAAGKLELHPSKVDVAQAVQDAAERFSELFSQAGCTLVLDAQGPLHSWCDPLRLEQVLTNLLSNAAKYGAGQPVHVRATGSEQEVWISVRDQGIGIASQDLPRLFQRFERVVSSHHYGGLGLGLYISRQLVGAMGGSIHVESRLGEGTHFLVTLPRGHPDPSAPERQGLAGQSAEGSSRRA